MIRKAVFSGMPVSCIVTGGRYQWENVPVNTGVFQAADLPFYRGGAQDKPPDGSAAAIQHTGRNGKKPVNSAAAVAGKGDCHMAAQCSGSSVQHKITAAAVCEVNTVAEFQQSDINLFMIGYFDRRGCLHPEIGFADIDAIIIQVFRV